MVRRGFLGVNEASRGWSGEGTGVTVAGFIARRGGATAMREIRARLELELRSLERELTVELPREIKTAVAMGDLRENAEYQAALERQRYVKARIGQLRTRLSELGTMNLDRIPKDRVGLGTRVSLLDLDTDAEVTFELVIPEMADLERGLVSIASPVGKGLMGRKEGDEVTIHVPSGTKRYELLGLITIHELEARE
jgi:transcription elongation factor GreA